MDLSTEALGVIAASASATAAFISARISSAALKINNSPRIKICTDTNMIQDSPISLAAELTNVGRGSAHIYDISWFLRGKYIPGENFYNALWEFVYKEGLDPTEFTIRAHDGNETIVVPNERLTMFVIKCKETQQLERLTKRGISVYMRYESSLDEAQEYSESVGFIEDIEENFK